MRDTERIIMIMRYVYVCDSFLKDEYLNKLDNYIKSNNTYIEEILELYRAKIRYEAFKEFCYNIDRSFRFCILLTKREVNHSRKLNLIVDNVEKLIYNYTK